MSGIRLIESGVHPTEVEQPYSECPLCGFRTPGRLGTIASYQMPGSHPVFGCTACKAHFSLANSGFEKIYEMIYRQRNAMPGYARYEYLANNIRSENDPLLWLANQEDVYWGIREAVRLEAVRHQKLGKLKIVDMGCGLGYLTHALRTTGHDCTGLDISEEATAAAKTRFGPYYETATINDYYSVKPSSPDIIVMAELIEHLVDPLSSLRDCIRCLSPSGAIIITTPNLDAYSASTVWVSDPPPVHLWLFSENSLRVVAKMLGCDATFINFRNLNRSSFLPRELGLLAAPPVRPGFDANGNPMLHAVTLGLLARWSRTIRVRGPINRIRSLWQDAFHHSTRRPVMCCILRRKSQEILEKRE